MRFLIVLIPPSLVLQLLSDLLLDRSNYTVMMRYIGDKHNLRRVMTLLADRSPVIQVCLWPSGFQKDLCGD
jgi:hypothetical protein